MQRPRMRRPAQSGRTMARRSTRSNWRTAVSRSLAALLCAIVLVSLYVLVGRQLNPLAGEIRLPARFQHQGTGLVAQANGGSEIAAVQEQGMADVNRDATSTPRPVP